MSTEAEDDPDVEMETTIELASLEELEPYANNPKQHPESQITKIATSIENTGWDVPIVVSVESGEIIKGHGRYEAAKHLGLEQVPVIWREGMSPEEVTSARIADNKTQMESGFDYDALGEELGSLNSEFDMELDEVAEQTAFDETIVDDLASTEPEGADELFDFEDGEADSSDSDASEGADNPSEESEGEAGDGSGEAEDSEDTADADGEDPVEYEAEATCPECGHEFGV